MMAKTHLSIGLASALTILAPHDLTSGLAILTGASIGSVICDIDCGHKLVIPDTITGRMAACGIAVAALVADCFLGCHMLSHALQTGTSAWIALGLFVVTCILAMFSEHRVYSHSLMALILEGLTLWFFMPSIVPAFAVGFLSHILVDLTNKKPVQIFFPIRMKLCLGLFYAGKTANTVFFTVGCIWLAGIFVVTVLRILGIL